MNPLDVLIHQPWVARLGWTLLHFLWQGALIAAVVWLMRQSGSRAPQFRYATACAGLAAMAAAPLITFLMLGDGSAAASPAAWAAAAAATGAAAASPAAFSLGSGWERLSPWLGAAWLVGVFCASARLLGGWLVAARLRSRNATPAPVEWHECLFRLMRRVGVSRAVQLRVSAAMEVPAVIGWLRPVILVPAGALAGMPAGQLEALLAHELAHIRRHDYLVNLLQSLLEAVLFYHPGVWWVSRQIRAEREHCCDDAAVEATGGDVLTYARALADLEACRPAHRPAMAASGGSLRQRIRRLADRDRGSSHTVPGPGTAWGLGVVLLAALAAAAACGNARAVQAQEPVVAKSSLWPDTVKQGDVKLEVRGLGTLTSTTDAEVKLAQSQAKDVIPGLMANIDFPHQRKIIAGRVKAVRPGVTNGVVTADLEVLAPPPDGIHIGDQIDVTVVVGNINNVVYVGRPVFGATNGEAILFKIEPDGQHATRVKVQFGQASVNQIVVKSGLQPGDQVILSDMKAYERYDRITLQ